VILRLSRFEPLSSEIKDALRRGVKRSPLYSPYANLLRDGARDVTMLLTGMACRFKLMGNGKRQITGILVPGDICDFGFLTSSPPPGPLMTTTYSQVGRIPGPAFMSLFESDPSLMLATLSAAATEAALSQERVISLGSRIAVERVSHLLCEIRSRLDAVGLVGPGNSFELPLTQAEIGEALGLSTVHVNRTLQVLRRDKIITMRSGKVTIEDLPRLTERAGFDDSYLRPARLSP
jgi:CRP-like cAMP-binding protein